jgi:acetylornithine deacetylase
MNASMILTHLQALVECDTQNPPRRIDGDSAIFKYCSKVVGDRFETKVWDHGDGHVSWLAVRGKPGVLFNVHLDTVPVGEGWTSDPHQLQVTEGRAFGRGACDIKGAAAALLSLAQEGAENLAMLFTSDEEGAGGCCVSRFLDAGQADRFDQVIVAEPTSCRAVLGHRGFLSVKTRFHGVPGHSSEARALQENANHQMARWAAGTLRVAENRKMSESDPGSCLNIGIIDGGSKSNVIAGSAFVHWSARLKPGDSNEKFLSEVMKCDTPGSTTEWDVPFRGEPLPAGGRDDTAARQFCFDNGLPLGKPVDFWTEASMFSKAGLPAIVLGPGDIEQAHAADEWVAVEQLETACKLYARVVKGDG